jgi:hypothetical protein
VMLLWPTLDQSFPHEVTGIFTTAMPACAGI